MINRKNVGILILALIAPIAVGRASAERNDARSTNNFPVRVISMVKSISNSATIVNFNKNTISRTYGSDMARIFMARDSVSGVPYLQWIIPRSHYCLIRLKPGSICGINELPVPLHGELFISNWIHGGEERYVLMIISGTGPERTIIARVTYKKGVDVLYDTFAKRQVCPLPYLPPEQVVPGVDRIATVIRVKTLSPTRYELYEKSHGGIVRSAKLTLSIGPQSCRLNAKTETFYTPPTASQPGRIEKAYGGAKQTLKKFTH